MNSGVKRTREERLDAAAHELRRIERSIPAFIENAHFIAGKSGGRALIVQESNPGVVDRRGAVLRWLIPKRSGACRIRLDAYGAFVAEQINGRRSSLEIIKAFRNSLGREHDPEDAREACLLFLRSLAKRGVICMVEKDG